jgi:thymidine kinase
MKCIDKPTKVCSWCSNSDYRIEFNLIEVDGSTVVTDDHMVVGGLANYCPRCGRKLNE